VTDLLTAIGLVLILEGLLYGAFPSIGKRLGEMLQTTPEETLRVIGIGSAMAGLIIIWFVRG
jgi:uncharacterized protein YjeT (DUF2065 family)